MNNKSNLPSPNSATDETSLKYMLKLAAPMIVTNISFTAMQFVDRFMVSRLGTNALAAILPAGILAFLPASFAIGVMTSVNTFVSQSLGRGQKTDCSRYCWQAAYMGWIYMVAVIAAMWPAAPWIFQLQGLGADVVRMEVIYFRIVLCGMTAAVVIWSTSQFFMGIHRPIITMYAALCAQVVNVCANYILIFGKFGFPAMGIAGAAWGTFIGIMVGAAIRMAMFLGPSINSTFQCRKTTRIDFGKMADLLKVGLPAGVGLMVNVAVWGIILTALVGKFGKEAVAATSAVFSCINLSVMPVVGISAALTAAVGKSIGAGRKDIATKQTSVSLKVALIYMGCMGICFFVFRDNIMSFWSGDTHVIEAGINILICVAVFQVFDAATIIYNGVLRGAGDTVWLAAIASFGAFVILGIGGWAMIIFFPQLGSLGPWIAATLNVVAMGLANRWRFKSNKWMRIDLFKRRPVGQAVEIDAVIK